MSATAWVITIAILLALAGTLFGVRGRKNPPARRSWTRLPTDTPLAERAQFLKKGRR